MAEERVKNMRFGLKGTGFGRWSRAAAFIAAALCFASVQSSFAKDWSCTPSVDAKTLAAVVKFTDNKYVIDGNLDNVRSFEKILKKRLGLKSDLVPCVGSTCKISDALYKLMHIGEDDRADGNVTFCSIDDLCINRKCQGDQKSAQVVYYLWGNGTLIFQLVKFTSRDVIAGMNKMLEFDLAYNPHIRNSLSRFIGLSSSSAIYIDYEVYNDD